MPAKYCSNKCRQRSKYLPGGTYWKNPIICAECGKACPRWAKSVEGRSRCPSCRNSRLKCRVADCERMVHARKMCRRHYGAEHGSDYRAMRRAAFVKKVDREKVFKSDGYKCHICGRRTDPALKFPHPRSPTIDHLIPLARGGKHEPENCRTACFQCNSRKSDGGGGDQFALFIVS